MVHLTEDNQSKDEHLRWGKPRGLPEYLGQKCKCQSKKNWKSRVCVHWRSETAREQAGREESPSFWTSRWQCWQLESGVRRWAKTTLRWKWFHFYNRLERQQAGTTWEGIWKVQLRRTVMELWGKLCDQQEAGFRVSDSPSSSTLFPCDTL